MDAVAGQIESALAQLPVELLDDIVVADSEVRIWDEASSRAVARINERLSGIISATRIRSAAERRKRTAVDWEQGLTEEDYDLLAKKHKTTRDAAKAICRLFEKCFDDRGNFQRPAFEQQAPAFADHPGRVFEILWEFLTVASRRGDRLPLLNSFQLLNERVQQPVKVIRFLLSDFAGDSEDIRFPDRNAMMLMIQMLRTYNKERHMDIEITPEEVLQVKVGLDRKVAAYTAWRMDTDHDRILAKTVTVRKSLVETLESGAETAGGMAFRFLLALERELHMFLALCGGGSAATVVRGSLNIYGDPDSELYKIDGSAVHLASLMQHLSVLIRSMARLGEADDIGALAEIGSRRQGFERLEDTARHRASVRRVLGWTDPAISEIKVRLAAGR